MLYPDDEMRARAWTVRKLAPQAAQRLAAGELVAPSLLQEIALLANVTLDDVDDRHFLGTMSGELLKAYYALFMTDASLASWNNASLIAEVAASRNDAKGARSMQWKAKSEFETVAHLWAAWCFRGRRIFQQLDVAYTFEDDIQAFFAEAEMFRMWGQTWRQARDKSVPPLPAEVWTVGPDWHPPYRKPNWPQTGGLPHLTLEEEVIAATGLKPSGRPRLNS